VADADAFHLTGARLRRAPVFVLALLAVLAAALSATPAAHGQGQGTPGYRPPVVTVPSQLPETPFDYSVSASEAINTANADRRVEELRRKRGGLSAVPQATRGTWEINYIKDNQAIALVVVDGNSDKVENVWTGPQVIWPMARGYEGQFGHLLNAPYVWIPLALLFFLGLFDFRAPLRIAHLDLVMLLSFGISEAFFNAAEIGVSVPLAYVPLVYLLARTVWIGFKGPGAGLRPSVPIGALLICAVLLCGGRIALNVVDSEPIDVGYAGVIGADRITHGEPIYGEGAFPDDNPKGDTYGPFNYAAYIPFELAFPWHGFWDKLPSAHAASIFFDLACVLGLFVLGRRLRPGREGRRLGVILAFAWLAYPYTDYALQSNSNDSLLGALLIWGLVGFRSIGWRAASLALAAGAKFTPIVLAPLFATGEVGLAGKLRLGGRDEDGRRRWVTLDRKLAIRLAYFLTVFLAILAALYVYPAIDPGLTETWHRTISTQLNRESPFSIWGQVTSLQPLQTLLSLAVAAFGASLALVPRRRTLVQATALSAAVMVAVEIPLEHWFYLYIPWFFGLVIAAIAPGDVSDEGRRRPPPVAARGEPQQAPRPKPVRAAHG
jgi:hypothetical protein